MGRPGIMLYFDILEPIRVLSDAEKGRLLVAMLEYGQHGIVPQFDGLLALAWGFIKPKIDKDEAEYNMSVLRRQYATVCRERKKKGEPMITFDDWLKSMGISDNQASSMMTNDNQWYPTTTTTTTTSTTPTTTTSTSTTPTTTTSQRTPEGDFEQLWNSYPQERRGNKQQAMEAFRVDITSEEDADQALENLKLWKQSEQWVKDKGQYVPYLDNWLTRGIWRTKPTKMAIPRGASGELGEAELEAIRRVLAEGVD